MHIASIYIASNHAEVNEGEEIACMLPGLKLFAHAQATIQYSYHRSLNLKFVLNIIYLHPR